MTKLSRRGFMRFAAVAAGLPTIASAARAQTYPSRPITLVVPYPAGGAIDVLARILAQSMTAALGQAVVIENVGGAGGTIAVGRVARAAPDGHSLILATGDQFVANAAIYPVQYRRRAGFRADRAACKQSFTDRIEKWRAGERPEAADRLDEVEQCQGLASTQWDWWYNAPLRSRHAEARQRAVADRALSWRRTRAAGYDGRTDRCDLHTSG